MRRITLARIRYVVSYGHLLLDSPAQLLVEFTLTPAGLQIVAICFRPLPWFVTTGLAFLGRASLTFPRHVARGN